MGRHIKGDEGGGGERSISKAMFFRRGGTNTTKKLSRVFGVIFSFIS